MSQLDEVRSRNEQVVREYFELLDQRSTGDVRDIFAPDAVLSMPGYGTLHGIDFVVRTFPSRRVRSVHHVDEMKIHHVGNTVVVEGTTAGVTADGREWDGRTGWSGRFCNVFELQDGRITRLSVYLDPDFAKPDLVWTGELPDGR